MVAIMTRIKNNERCRASLTTPGVGGRDVRFIGVYAHFDPSRFLSEALSWRLPIDDRRVRSLALKDDGSRGRAVSSLFHFDQFVSDPELVGLGFSKGTLFDEALLASGETGRALGALCDYDVSQKASTLVNDRHHKTMIKRYSQKRGRSSRGTFDLSDLVEATQPVADSISFPAIEWSFLGDGDSDAERVGQVSSFRSHGDRNDISLTEPNAKRQCRGLIRSKQLRNELFRLGDDH